MIEITVSTPGLGEIDDDLVREFMDSLTPVVDEMAAVLEGEMKAKLSRVARATRTVRSRTSGGAVFSGKGRSVSAAGAPSAAGQPPARQSGRLLGSIKRTAARRRGKYRIDAEVGSDDNEYAARLEFGGPDDKGRIILPHPWRRPATDAAEPKIEAILRGATDAES